MFPANRKKSQRPKFVYPTLLDFNAPRLLGYTPETRIAETFEAMEVVAIACNPAVAGTVPNEHE